MPTTKEKIRKLRARADNEMPPTDIDVFPSFEGDAVVRFQFSAGHDVVFDLSDADEVTDEPEALESGSLVVGVYDVDGMVQGPRDVYLFHEFEEREKQFGTHVEAFYTRVSPGRVNETQHNRAHLTSCHDRGVDARFFQFTGE